MQVKLFANLRKHIDQATIVASGSTVREALLDICAAHPSLQTEIFDGDKLGSYVRVMVNGRDIELADGLDTPVIETDQIAVFPPIAGGQLIAES